MLNRDALAQSNEKIAVGSKRMKELKSEIEELGHKKRKMIKNRHIDNYRR